MNPEAIQPYVGKLPIFPVHGIRDGRCTCGRDCTSPGKHPLTPNGVLDASTDPAVIAAWWQRWPYANVALATGHVYVIDLDGPEGITAWRELTRDHPEANETRIARTGGGGYHVYYIDPTGDLRNTHWKLGSHIDTRGKGGYVLLPPSDHASGATYTWRQAQPPQPLPEWLRTLLTPRVDTPQQPPRIRYGETSRYGYGVLRHAVNRVRRAQEGERNTTLNDEAFLVGQFIGGGEIDPRTVEEQLIDASTDPDRKKVQATVRRALHDGATYPRAAPADESIGAA